MPTATRRTLGLILALVSTLGLTGTAAALAQPVPEPSSTLLLALSVAGVLGGSCWYRRRAKAAGRARRKEGSDTIDPRH